MGKGEIGLQADRALEGDQGIISALLLQQGKALKVMGFSRFRNQDHCAFQANQGFLIAVKLHQCLAKIELSHRVARIEGYGAAEQLHGVFKPA